MLDAGYVEETREGDRGWRLVHPPRRTMFEQVLAYLERQSDPGWQGLRLGREAIAAVAVCLRWGSYLSVLLDEDKPLWPQVQQDDSGAVSRISDAEMARINIEISAALEQWVDIMRSDFQRYLRLVWVAGQCLPMTRKSVGKEKEYLILRALANPDFVQEIVAARTTTEWGQARLAETQIHPTRVFANTLTNVCWRNNDSVENIHAGRAAVLPLAQHRITKREERILVRTIAERLAHGIAAACLFSQSEQQNERTWVEQVLPYNLVPDFLVTPREWSLEESTRSVRLFGAEPL